MKTFLIDQEKCSRVRSKRSLERGSCEGLGMAPNCKRLTVDHDHQCDIPQMKKIKLGGERQAIAPLKLPGLSAPTNTKCKSTKQLVFQGKEALDGAEKISSGKEVLDGTEKRSSGKETLDSTEKRSSGTAEIRNAKVARIDKFKPLTPVIAKRMDEGALKVSGNDLRNKVGLGTAESRNLRVTHFDKFKPVAPVSEKRIEDREDTGIICTSQSNMERPKFRCQFAGGSSYGSKCHVGRMSYDYSRPKSSIQRKSSSMSHSPEVECFDVAPSLGVQDAVKHKPYDSEGRKNEIISAEKLDHLGFEVDESKASEQNFVGRKSSTCSGKEGMVGLSDNSGIHNSSYALRDHKDNIPYNQKTRCESTVLNLNSAPYNDDQVRLYRDEVRKVLDLYKDTVERLQQERKMNPMGKGGMQIYVDAAMQLKEKWLNMQKCVGAVPGVEVGDQFHRRAELVIIGLHRKFLAGIDFKKIDGTLYATSIVASGRYGDKTDSSDFLVYVGEGGKPNSSSGKVEDQKLVRGNLALKNSIDKFPVRVIRSIKNMTAPKSLHANTMDKSKYFYDGLYIVRKCWSERERHGNLVFKFRLERIHGQQELTRLHTQNASRTYNKASHGPVVVHDISKGKENTPIRVVNGVDCEKPRPFKYTTKMIHHFQQSVITKPGVCDCLNGCAEDIACCCVIKNNRQVSVNNSVLNAEKKPIVYECGPSCKCPPDCKNRRTQHGIKLQLEIFRSITKQWSVRSRNYISEGRFICEYVGELLQYMEREGRIDFDESSFDSQGYPILQSSSSPKGVNDAINVKFGNVGRFIRHSSSPNLYARCVLFDHEDEGRPHVMLFAAKNIPPKKELLFDYKLW